jgi:hypothetical protein
MTQISSFIKFFIFIIINQQLVNCEMIFEMQLIEFKNPLNNTYSNKPCGENSSLLNSECNTSFLFCLVDLPFRNPQNCSLGDFTTPVLGSNYINFTPNVTNNYTYQFLIRKLPSQGIGMMIEVRDMFKKDKWESIDFYTSALADVPLSSRSINTTYTVKKKFSSLFNHNSTLIVKSRVKLLFFNQ